NCINYINIDIPIYYRYVDDTLLAIPQKEIKKVFDTFNSYHSRIKFTLEKSIDGWINFLDVKLCIENERILFDIFKKPTNSGRYLNYHSNHSLCHKKGVVTSLFDRILLLSHPKFHIKNIQELINTSTNNGYPFDFLFASINNIIKSFIHSENNDINLHNNDTYANKKFFSVPYHNNVSEKFKKIFGVDSEIKIAYKPINSLNQIIKLGKDKLDKFDNTNVVYKIDCLNCDRSYVGQTKRNLKTRIKGHRADIKKLHNKSVVSKHQMECNHTMDWDNVHILDNEPSYMKRSISEMIFIKKQLNGLNLQSDTKKFPENYITTLLNHPRHPTVDSHS
ncbi:hypothetical protein ALC62_00718, partial [Cyphomyrmex costatus]